MMKLSEKDITRLEEYWQGKLDEQEQKAIEKELNDNQAFREAANNWQWLVDEGFKPTEEELTEQAAIRKRLQGYELEKKSKPFNYRRLYIGLAIAASVLLVLWLSPLNRLFVGEDSYADYFNHLPRDNANLSDKAVDGQKAYDEKNYKQAYPALLAELEAGVDSLNIIYAAVAAIGSDQSAKAIPLLEPLLDREGWQFYQTEIQWYLALAYLEQKEIEKAKKILEKLQETAGEYAEQAARLVNDLKEK